MSNNFIKNFGLNEKSTQNIVNVNQKIEYINDQYNNANDITKANTLRFFNRVGNFNNRKDLCNFNLVELENLFRKEFRISSQASFDYTKTVIRKYFEWCADKQLISKIIIRDIFDNFKYEYVYDAENIKQKLFADFNDLKNGIDTIIGKLSPIDKSRYYMNMIFMYLNWFGFTTNEICSIKKTDIDYENKMIIKGYKNISMTNIVMNIINDYLNSTSYSVNGSTQILQYQPSIYLIRKTSRMKNKNKENIRYTQSDIDGKMSSFTKCTQELDKDNRYYNHQFCLDDIRMSGVYFRIYDYCKPKHFVIDDLSNDILEKLMYDSITNANRRNLIIDYNYWKQTFNK